MIRLKQIIILVIFILVATLSDAQDLIYLRGQKHPLKVKVTEVGLDEIKYQYWPVNEGALVLAIYKENISKVVMQNGDILSFENYGMTSKPDYAGQRKHALKFSLFSPLYGQLAFSYEKSIHPGRSMELGIGLIGVGRQVNVPQPWGGFVRAGIKFINTPDFYIRGMRYSHLLKGGYVKPEIIVSSHSYRGGIFGCAALLNIGRQVVYDDTFLIDYFFGLGYGYSSSPDRNGEYYYAFGGGGDFPMAISAGFKIGFLAGKKDKAETAEPLKK